MFSTSDSSGRKDNKIRKTPAGSLPRGSPSVGCLNIVSTFQCLVLSSAWGWICRADCQFANWPQKAQLSRGPEGMSSAQHALSPQASQIRRPHGEQGKEVCAFMLNSIRRQWPEIANCLLWAVGRSRPWARTCLFWAFLEAAAHSWPFNFPLQLDEPL